MAAPIAADGLSTEVGLIVGRPGTGVEDQGVLVVPGIVIPAQSDGRLDDVLSRPGGADEARRLVRNTRLKQVSDNLKQSLRLSEVEVRYQMRFDLPVNGMKDLPPPASASDVHISIKLLGFNATTASYEVQFYEGSTPITDTPLTVQRGKQAVVGGLDGEAAPYLFLVIAPDAAEPLATTSDPMHVEGDVKPPLPIERIPPAYTPEAKERRIQGAVVVQTIIGVDGRVSDVKVLRGLSHGLTKAATDTIRRWRFEPATLNGEPVAVYYNLTVNFRLKKDAKEKDGKEKDIKEKN